MKKQRTAGTQKPSAKRQGGQPSRMPQEKLKKHTSARRLSALEKKRKARVQRLKTTGILLAAFFGVSALLLALRLRAPSQQKAQAESDVSSLEIAQEEVEAKLPPAPEPQVEGAQKEPLQGAQEIKEEPSPPSPSPSLAARDEAKEPSSSSFLVPEGSATLCFVFDDAGHNLFQLEPFLSLPFPCTIAVLPALPHSAECAKRIRDAGKEAILHQPMQAINLNVDPGPGAVLPGMSPEETRDVVNANLDEIWPVAGLNNHEGSLITGDSALMEAVFDVVEERSIFFLDSRTIAETAAPKIAAERGMRILERAVFLDNSQERDEIRAAVMQGVRAAGKAGHAVMIGHVWSDELAEILIELYPSLVKAGYKIANLSSLLASLESP